MEYALFIFDELSRSLRATACATFLFVLSLLKLFILLVRVVVTH